MAHKIILNAPEFKRESKGILAKFNLYLEIFLERDRVILIL